MSITEPCRRRTAATAAAASAALLLGGCSFWAPNTAVQPYAPSYGVQSELGELLVRNVLVVSEGDGEAGLLAAGLANRGDEDLTVTIEVGGTVDEIDLPADATLLVGEPDASTDVAEDVETVRFVVDAVDPIPGDVIEVVVSDGVSGSVTLRAPVYLPEGIWAEFEPSEAG